MLNANRFVKVAKDDSEIEVHSKGEMAFSTHRTSTVNDDILPARSDNM